MLRAKLKLTALLCTLSVPTTTMGQVVQESKICQITGGVDRGGPQSWTGMSLTGISSGVNATDIGYAVESPANNRLYFLFGDTHEWPVDRCEPFLCGTSWPSGGTPAIPTSGPWQVERWRTGQEFERWKAFHGDGEDNFAIAPLDTTNPDQCVKPQVQTERRGAVFVHSLTTTTVDTARQLTGPQIGARPEDKRLLIVGDSLLALTQDGRVFAHKINASATGIDLAYQLGGALVGANSQDKWVLAMGNRILVITQDGRVFAHDVNATVVSPAVQLSGPLVAANAGDKQVLVDGDRLLVVVSDGRVFSHPVSGNTVLPAYQLGASGSGSPPPVGTSSQDKWIVVKRVSASERQLLVVTRDGSVFAHALTDTTIAPAFQLANTEPVPTTVGTDPNGHDVLALTYGSRLLIWHREETFRPTRLNGRVLGRKEGVLTGFADDARLYGFVTRRTFPPTCAGGCGHDEGGGKTSLAFSDDGTGQFEEVMHVSSSKFMFPSPEVVDPSTIQGLPDLLSPRAVIMFGTGREQASDTTWNQSFPYLAVANTALVTAKDGTVFAHGVSSGTVAAATQLAVSPSYPVATNVDDKWVTTVGARVVVVTRDGRVFAHAVSATSVDPAIQLSGSAAISNRPRWVLGNDNQLIIVDEDGRVRVHAVTSSAVAAATELAAPSGQVRPLVGTLADDRWGTVIGNRLFTVRSNGKVSAYSFSGTTIQPAVELSGELQGVLNNAPLGADDRVLGVGNRLMVIAASGSAFAYVPGTNSLGSKAALSSSQLIANNPQDRWLLPLGASTSSSARLLVLSYKPKWWAYFSGMGTNGQPTWTRDEALAQPVTNFGAERDGNGNLLSPNFHRCMGYFSVRWVQALSKWVMLYTCWQSNPVVTRGVYVRYAAKPWGPWSPPAPVFGSAGTIWGYCNFMYSEGPCSTGVNPYEECVRKLPFNGTSARNGGGEYAPLLLPGRYQKVTPAWTTLYYSMSTWNPYQSVLMKVQVPTPAP